MLGGDQELHFPLSFFSALLRALADTEWRCGDAQWRGVAKPGAVRKVCARNGNLSTYGWDVRPQAGELTQEMARP